MPSTRPAPLPSDPGIRGLFAQFPSTAPVLRQLAHVLLHLPLERTSPLSRFEREFIAAYISHLNNTPYCFQSHLEIAQALNPVHAIDMAKDVLASLQDKSDDEIINSLPSSPRLTLLLFAAALISDFKPLPPTILSLLTREELASITLIVGAFHLFNRYVTYLNPSEATPTQYREAAAHIAQHGYLG